MAGFTMNRFIFAGIAAALAFTLALIAAGASYAEQSGFQNISFNEQAAIEQVLNVIGGVNLRQADRASSQTLKEFTEWRERTETTGSQTNTAGRQLPPARDRKAF